MTFGSAVKVVVLSAAAAVLLYSTHVPAVLIASPAALISPVFRSGDWCYGPAQGFVEVLSVMVACGGCLGIFLLAMVLPVIATLLIAFWMAYDARRRGDPNFVLWGLVGLLLNVLGLLIYLVTRTSSPQYAPATAPVATKPISNDPPINPT